MKNENKLDIELKSVVTELLRKGKKVEAVVMVQERLRLGLKGSKDLVDSLETAASETNKNPP